MSVEEDERVARLIRFAMFFPFGDGWIQKGRPCGTALNNELGPQEVLLLPLAFAEALASCVSFSSVAFSSARLASSRGTASFRPSCLAHSINVP